MHWGDLWKRFTAGDAGAVEALGTWATVIVGVVAAAFVWWQIRQSRITAVEQAQPNVVAIMQSNRNQPEIVEVAFRNFGLTAARDVVITTNPPLQRVGQDGTVQDVWLPALIPYLAPGEEWRTIWDYAPRRFGSEHALPLETNVSVRYQGLGGKQRESTALFDWSAHKGRRFLDQKSIHHAAKALDGINGTLRNVLENHRDLRVVVRDGELRDAEEDGWISGRAATRHAWTTRAGRVRRPSRHP